MNMVFKSSATAVLLGVLAFAFVPQARRVTAALGCGRPLEPLSAGAAASRQVPAIIGQATHTDRATTPTHTGRLGLHDAGRYYQART